MIAFISSVFRAMVGVFFWVAIVANVIGGIILLPQQGPIIALLSVVAGILLTVFLFGTLALLIENNRLLRKIADQHTVVERSPSTRPELSERSTRVQDPPLTARR